MWLRALAVLALPVIAAAQTPAGAAPPAGTRALFHLQDARLGEVSGIAVGIASPGVAYVHNDGGDSPRFFAVDLHTGRTLVTYTVPNATNVDWEDIAVAPDADGVPSVWLADIGDNDAERTEVDVYRVDEPHVTASGSSALTAEADVWRLRYPDGAKDSESLAVDPHGRAYIFSKSKLGATKVYALPPRPAAAVQTLRRVGSIRFGFTGASDPVSPLGQLMATGADISRSGSLLVVRTYTDAYLWPLPGADLGAALKAAHTRLELPSQPQGEGIAFDGATLLIDSEKSGSSVYSVPIPAAVSPSSAGVPATTSHATGTSAVVESRKAVPPWRFLVALAAVTVAGGASLWRVRRRRTGRAPARRR
jgi:hypothetical protein